MKLDANQICDRLVTMISDVSKVLPLGPHSPENGQRVYKFAVDNKKPSVMDVFSSFSRRPQPVPVQRNKSRDFPF